MRHHTIPDVTLGVNNWLAVLKALPIFLYQGIIVGESNQRNMALHGKFNQSTEQWGSCKRRWSGRTMRSLITLLQGYHLLVRSTNTGESIDQHIQNSP